MLEKNVHDLPLGVYRVRVLGGRPRTTTDRVGGKCGSTAQEAFENYQLCLEKEPVMLLENLETGERYCDDTPGGYPVDGNCRPILATGNVLELWRDGSSAEDGCRHSSYHVP